MYTPRIMMSSVCAAALLTASSAAAEVTATEVWANWKDSLAIYGEGSLIVENEVVGADSVVAEGVALSYSDGTGSMSADLGTITLQEVGDGTVEVSMAETFPIMISDPDGGSPKVTVTQEGLVLLVSGLCLYSFLQSNQGEAFLRCLSTQFVMPFLGIKTHR